MTNNPTGNSLPAGMTVNDVLEAIQKSGYPLQNRVAEAMLRQLSNRQWSTSIQQEWSYTDPETKELRALDLAAELDIFDKSPWPAVRPIVDVLVECKQMELPLVFFPAITPPRSTHFPTCAGLRGDRMTIDVEDESSAYPIWVWMALGVEGDPFVSHPTVESTSFSKLTRHGKKLELSGADAFHGIVIPLGKALKHLKSQYEPDHEPDSCHAVIPVAVIDGPIVVHEQQSDSESIQLSPWVRLLRHENTDTAVFPLNESVFGIDVVHMDFLDEYLSKHLLPFAKRFSQRVLRHQLELRSGNGVVPTLGTRTLQDLERSMRPRPSSKDARAKERRP